MFVLLKRLIALAFRPSDVELILPMVKFLPLAEVPMLIADVSLAASVDVPISIEVASGESIDTPPLKVFNAVNVLVPPVVTPEEEI